jgi:hypothetical protein
VFIGVRSGFMNELKKELEDEINRHEDIRGIVNIGTIKETFDNYISIL